jgi:Putative translation initiation inhibitor, yjgF family
MTIERHGVACRYTDVVAHGDKAYLVATGKSLDEDITTQTREALASIDSGLALAGSDKSRLLQVVVYLPSMADYDAMNAVWDNWVPEGTAPSRACIQAGLANLKMRIEIVVTAAR